MPDEAADHFPAYKSWLATRWEELLVTAKDKWEKVPKWEDIVACIKFWLKWENFMSGLLIMRAVRNVDADGAVDLAKQVGTLCTFIASALLSGLLQPPTQIYDIDDASAAQNRMTVAYAICGQLGLVFLLTTLFLSVAIVLINASFIKGRPPANHQQILALDHIKFFLSWALLCMLFGIWLASASVTLSLIITGVTTVYTVSLVFLGVGVITSMIAYCFMLLMHTAKLPV